MSRTALVTGANGFVGVNLVRTLLERDWQVIAFVRDSSDLVDLDGLGITLRYGDVTDIDSLHQALPQGCDAVFHVAASTNVWARHNELQTRINVGGTENVISACEAAGVGRLIHTSSFATWGFVDPDFDESTPRSSNGDWINYIHSKHQAEQAVLGAVAAGRVDAVVTNPGHILGPYDRHNWSRMFRMVAEESLPGVPPGGGAFADVREVARAHVEAFDKGGTGQRYLLGGVDASYLDLVEIVGDLLNKPVPDRTTPAWLLRTVARLKSGLSMFTGTEPDLTPESTAMIIHHMHCDSSRARNELGYRHTPLETLAGDTCRWMQSAGLLPEPGSA